MKQYITITACISVLLLVGCITDYEAKGIKEINEILVVDGIVTNGESLITLSRSAALTNYDPASFSFINNAEVYVECDDGTIIKAAAYEDEAYPQNGRYFIPTGTLQMDRKYRLKIEIEENNSTNEYCSDYASPIETPVIDSIFWTKKARGEPVLIHIATHSSDTDAQYYRWTFQEDWEIKSDAYLEGYPYYCWNLNTSSSLLVGSAENNVYGRIIDIITEIHPANRKLEQLYRISVNQNAISKRAYDYFANIKKNSDQTGSIFAPVPSELRGNITCTTDPGRPVVGYIDISTTTQNQLFITRSDPVSEFVLRECTEVEEEELLSEFEMIPENYLLYYSLANQYGGLTDFYILDRCVDCSLFGTTQGPDNWPTEH